MNYEEFLIEKNKGEEKPVETGSSASEPESLDPQQISFEDMVARSIAAKEAAPKTKTSPIAQAKYYDAMGLAYPAKLQKELLQLKQDKSGNKKEIKTDRGIPTEVGCGYRLPTAVEVDGKEFSNILPVEGAMIIWLMILLFFINMLSLLVWRKNWKVFLLSITPLIYVIFDVYLECRVTNGNSEACVWGYLKYFYAVVVGGFFYFIVTFFQILMLKIQNYRRAKTTNV